MIEFLTTVSIDAVITQFLANNALTIAMLLVFIRALAEVSPWVWDEKVCDAIESMLSVFSRKKESK